jgi:HD-like signal output (HDOD) protein
MYLAKQAKQQVLKLQHLPPLSATATRLLDLMSEDSLALHELATVITQDPGLAARILGLANSAFFGQQNPVVRVEDAIIRVLGLNIVKSLAFSIAVSGTYDISKCRHFDLKRYWRDALSLASLSRRFGSVVISEESVDPDMVYLAGLLMEIGVLVLAHLFPERYNKVLQVSQQQMDGDILTLESEIIGINHQQAGAWLAHRWHLPSMIVMVIAQAGGKAESGEPKEVLLVGAVSRWLKQGICDEESTQQCRAILEECCGLSAESFDTIKTAFVDKEEEISVLANMLAS